MRRVAAVGSSVARSLLIPHKVSSLRCGTLRGPRVCVVKMRRRSFTPRFASKTIRSLAHFHSAGDEGMTLVGIWRAFAPALASRGASGVPAESIFGGVKMRPRKPDETLSRHGLGARRVALLAPRGVLNKYRHPLSYVGAITKIFGKVQKSVPHFGRRELYSEWGRSPGIWGPRKVPQRSEDTLWGFSEEGVCHSHVRGR